MLEFPASYPDLGHTVCLLRSQFSKMEISKQAMCPESGQEALFPRYLTAQFHSQHRYCLHSRIFSLQMAKGIEVYDWQSLGHLNYIRRVKHERY